MSEGHAWRERRKKSRKEESHTNREGGAERMSEAFINMMFVISDRLPQQMFPCVLSCAIQWAYSCACAFSHMSMGVHEVSALCTAQMCEFMCVPICSQRQIY